MIIEDTPETEIRADLWNHMTLEQLTRQQELLTTKLGAIQQLASSTSTSRTVMDIHNALSWGMKDLSALIESKSENN